VESVLYGVVGGRVQGKARYAHKVIITGPRAAGTAKAALRRAEWSPIVIDINVGSMEICHHGTTKTSSRIKP
jgi:hypothetical protein